MKVLFVDLENVCRSPMAEGILREKLKNYNVDVYVDSAGFESFNINEPPDKRVVEIADKYGYTLKGNARIFVTADFDKFDKILVMDTIAYNKVMELAKKDKHKNKVQYLMSFVNGGKNESIPNPYYSGNEGCEVIFKMIHSAVEKLAYEISRK